MDAAQRVEIDRLNTLVAEVRVDLDRGQVSDAIRMASDDLVAMARLYQNRYGTNEREVVEVLLACSGAAARLGLLEPAVRLKVCAVDFGLHHDVAEPGEPIAGFERLHSVVQNCEQLERKIERLLDLPPGERAALANEGTWSDYRRPYLVLEPIGLLVHLLRNLEMESVGHTALRIVQFGIKYERFLPARSSMDFFCLIWLATLSGRLHHDIGDDFKAARHISTIVHALGEAEIRFGPVRAEYLGAILDELGGLLLDLELDETSHVLDQVFDDGPPLPGGDVRDFSRRFREVSRVLTEEFKTKGVRFVTETPPADPSQAPAGLLRLNALATAIRLQVAAGSAEAAIERALGALIEETFEYFRRHRATSPEALHAFAACAEAANGFGRPDLAAPLTIRWAHFGIIHQGSLRDGVAPAAHMLLSAMNAVTELQEHLRHQRERSTVRFWLGAPEQLFHAVSDLVSMLLETPRDGEFKQILADLLIPVLELEVFIPPKAVTAMLAATATRFRAALLLCSAEQYERAEVLLRKGLTDLIDIESRFGAVPAEDLASAIAALRELLGVAGHFGPLSTLAIAFEGPKKDEGFVTDLLMGLMPGMVPFRIGSEGLTIEYADQLRNVLRGVEEGTPVNQHDLIRQAGIDLDGED